MWFIAMFLGFVLALGQAPVSFPIGVFTSIPILAYCAFRANTKKQAFAIGWCSGLGYFGFSMLWLIEPFFVEPEKHAIFAPFALFAFITVHRVSMGSDRLHMDQNTHRPMGISHRAVRVDLFNLLWRALTVERATETICRASSDRFVL